MNLALTLRRDVLTPTFTLGRLSVNGRLFGFTCEDRDRWLETGGVKVQNETAIPRGKYRVTLSYSPHFDRIMPEVNAVPGFSGVRIHGGNTAADTEGCPLLGAVRTDVGVRDCACINANLIALLHTSLDAGGTVTLEVT